MSKEKLSKNKKIHFCTSLAVNGVPKLGALITSIAENITQDYLIWVLCEDDATEVAVANLQFRTVKVVPLSVFETVDPGILVVKDQRDAFEYNCTVRPAWMLFILNSDPQVEFLTYVDNDLFFFNDPSTLCEEFAEASVLISPHRLSTLAKMTGIDVNVVGQFNAGWIAVKNDDEARKVLNWWREKCIEWCYRIPIAGKFGEQKYLDEFQSVSKKVGIVQHLGVNVAPWNMNDFNVFSRPDGKVMVENTSLIFFHFHALKIPGESAFKVDKELGEKTFQLTNPNYIIPKNIMENIYKPYLKVLSKFLMVGTPNHLEIAPSFWRLNNIHYFKKIKRLFISFKARILYYLILFYKAYRKIYPHT